MLFNEKVVPLLEKIDKFLGARKFVAGDNLTIVDFSLFELIDAVRHFDNEAFSRFANIKRLWTNFSELPAIKVFIVCIII